MYVCIHIYIYIFLEALPHSTDPIKGLKGWKWARGRPKWGTKNLPKASKWAHGKPKWSWGEPWAAKMQPKSAQVHLQGPGGDFGGEFWGPKRDPKEVQIE